ncbi:MAG: GMC family oxidoreductase [Planctomycetota bacterium]
MIYTYDHIQRDLKIQTDICIVGSGAGGSAAATEASKKGKQVLLLEAGSYLTPKDFNQLEDEMYSHLFWEKGGRANQDQSIQLIQGRGVGGSTLHNLNLCKRIPPEIRSDWRERFGIEQLTDTVWNRLYSETEQQLQVSLMDEKTHLNENNALLKKGCAVLGYRGGMLQHNRKNCIGAGFCVLGCSFNSKMNALRVLIPEAVERGVQVLANCAAIRLNYEGKKIVSLIAKMQHPKTLEFSHQVTITAKKFCISAGGTQSCTLLQRSQVPDPYGHLGKNLFIHPGVVVAGLFPDHSVYGWKGIPQSYECTEFLDFSKNSTQRVWLISAFAHPIGTASLLPGFGSEHRKLMQQLPHIAVVSAMIHDETSGIVKPKGEVDADFSYWPDPSEHSQYWLGLKSAAKILFAAGASEVLVPYTPMLRLTSPKNIDQIDSLAIVPHRLPITAVHPMGTLWMGKDPKTSVTNDTGRYHALENLYIADTSLFPTSIGVPPQLSTYALGKWVGSHLD